MSLMCCNLFIYLLCAIVFGWLDTMKISNKYVINDKSILCVTYGVDLPKLLPFGDIIPVAT